MSTYYKRPLTLLLAALCLAYWLPQITAQTTNRAALVVDYGNGQVQTQCVTFAEEQISGYDLLLRSGLDVAVDVQGMGTLICGIGDVGCPASNCLCPCSGGPNCTYWSYWRQVSGSWQFSQGGASMSIVTNGSVEGWTWGPGGVNQAIPPPNISFDEVCLPPPTATPTATATPIPPPQINFSVDDDSLQAGSCTTLRWQTAHIQAVYLNGNGVVGNEARQVCPEETQAFTLRVVHATGEETRTVTVTVLPMAQTATATPVALAPATATPRAGTSPVIASPTATPLPATAVSEVAAVVPTSTTTATPTIIWVTVPALPTETAVLPTEIAMLPPADETAAPATPAPEMADSADLETETAVDWLPYAIFLAILLGLGLLLVYKR